MLRSPLQICSENMMFEASAAHETDFEGNSDLADNFGIQSALRNSNLPQFVKTLPISQMFERFMDANEILRLTELGFNEKDNAECIEKLRIRREALRKHLGSTLTCVLIRLPGVLYTIEIDPVNWSIVHWELQQV